MGAMSCFVGNSLSKAKRNGRKRVFQRVEGEGCDGVNSKGPWVRCIFVKFEGEFAGYSLNSRESSLGIR